MIVNCKRFAMKLVKWMCNQFHLHWRFVVQRASCTVLLRHVLLRRWCATWIMIWLLLLLTLSRIQTQASLMSTSTTSICLCDDLLCMNYILFFSKVQNILHLLRLFHIVVQFARLISLFDGLFGWLVGVRVWLSVSVCVKFSISNEWSQ